MTVPVLYSFAKAFPQHQLVVLSRPNMAALFQESPPNLLFRGVDVKKEYAGVKGLFRLFLLLRREHFDYVADLHGVLRSRFLSFCFRTSGIKVACIDKERSKKKKLISQKIRNWCLRLLLSPVIHSFFKNWDFHFLYLSILFMEQKRGILRVYGSW